MWVDSHVNLHGEQFQDDLDSVMQRARNENIATMLTICCKVSEFDAVLSVAKQHSDIWASVGTHPHEARENPDIKAEDLIALSQDPNVIGIGETGLDFHYNYSESNDQYKNLMAHIEASRTTQLPLIIHSRNADQEMGDLIENEMKKGSFPALLHCYTGGMDFMHRMAELGLYFSLSGILSFKSAQDLREIAKKMPSDRLMIETDCPYLAPIPYRGRRNEPSFLPYVGQALADVKGWSLKETQARTTQAFFDLFTKATRPK